MSGRRPEPALAGATGRAVRCRRGLRCLRPAVGQPPGLGGSEARRATPAVERAVVDGRISGTLTGKHRAAAAAAAAAAAVAMHRRPSEVVGMNAARRAVARHVHLAGTVVRTDPAPALLARTTPGQGRRAVDGIGGPTATRATPMVPPEIRRERAAAGSRRVHRPRQRWPTETVAPPPFRPRAAVRVAAARAVGATAGIRCVPALLFSPLAPSPQPDCPPACAYAVSVLRPAALFVIRGRSPVKLAESWPADAARRRGTAAASAWCTASCCTGSAAIGPLRCRVRYAGRKWRCRLRPAGRYTWRWQRRGICGAFNAACRLERAGAEHQQPLADAGKRQTARSPGSPSATGVCSRSARWGWRQWRSAAATANGPRSGLSAC